MERGVPIVGDSVDSLSHAFADAPRFIYLCFIYLCGNLFRTRLGNAFPRFENSQTFVFSACICGAGDKGRAGRIAKRRFGREGRRFTDVFEPQFPEGRLN